MTSYHDLRVSYTASAARSRPYENFGWADLAAFARATEPAVVADPRRLGESLVPPRAEWPTTALVLVVVAVVAVADISGLGKAEVQRIRLPFAIWMALTCTQLPARHTRSRLSAQAGVALLINSLMIAGW